jgi:hypothetical protein
MGTKSAISGAGSGIASGSAFGPWGAAIGGVAGGLLGAFSDEGSDQEELYQEYLNKLESVTIPSLEELIAAGSIEGTAYEDIETDPAVRQATTEAMNALLAEGKAGGQSIESKAATEAALNQARQTERMQTAAIMEEMAQRGQSGGGSELAQRMMANQSAMSSAKATGLESAADARTRALESLSQAGQLGSTVRGQDWTEASAKASAKDALAQWNANVATNAYGNRTNWQLAKASAQEPAYKGLSEASAAKSTQAADTSAAAGELAGSIYGLASGKKKIKGYDASGKPIYES